MSNQRRGHCKGFHTIYAELVACLEARGILPTGMARRPQTRAAQAAQAVGICHCAHDVTEHANDDD